MFSSGRPQDRDQVELRLRAEVSAARDEFRNADLEFDRLVVEGPHRELLGTDGAQRSHLAFAARNAAFLRYDRALRRFTAFVNTGKVPDDLA